MLARSLFLYLSSPPPFVLCDVDAWCSRLVVASCSLWHVPLMAFWLLASSFRAGVVGQWIWMLGGSSGVVRMSSDERWPVGKGGLLVNKCIFEKMNIQYLGMGCIAHPLLSSVLPLCPFVVSLCPSRLFTNLSCRHGRGWVKLFTKTYKSSGMGSGPSPHLRPRHLLGWATHLSLCVAEPSLLRQSACPVVVAGAGKMYLIIYLLLLKTHTIFGGMNKTAHPPVVSVVIAIAAGCGRRCRSLQLW